MNEQVEELMIDSTLHLFSKDSLLIDSLYSVKEAKAPVLDLKLWATPSSEGITATAPFNYQTMVVPVNPSGLSGTPLVGSLYADNVVASLFFCCFILTSFLVSKGSSYLFSEAKNIASTRHSRSFFPDSGTSLENKYKLLLMLQLGVLIGLITYSLLLNSSKFVGLQNDFVFYILVVSFCVPVLIFLKWLFCLFFQWIFFSGSGGEYWIAAYSSVQSVFSLVLFPISLILFYLQLDSMITLYCLVILLILSQIVLFFLLSRIFMSKGYVLFYLFLYFCAVELMPCLLLYKSFVLLGNML